jgi:hypothetical protein
VIILLRLPEATCPHFNLKVHSKKMESDLTTMTVDNAEKTMPMATEFSENFLVKVRYQTTPNIITRAVAGIAMTQ